MYENKRCVLSKKREHAPERNRNRSENYGSNLLPDISGWNFWNFGLLGCWNTSDKVHLFPLADLCLFDELVTKVQAQEEDNVDVWRLVSPIGEKKRSCTYSR